MKNIIIRISIRSFQELLQLKKHYGEGPKDRFILWAFPMFCKFNQQNALLLYLGDEDFDFVLDEIIVGAFTLPEALHTLDEKKMTQATFNDKVEGKNDFTKISSGYTPPKGGGGVTDVIEVNGRTVCFGHGGRHLKQTPLTVSEVNKILAVQVSEIQLDVGQFFKGRVSIKGIELEYTAYGIKDGVVKVGTYYPVK